MDQQQVIKLVFDILGKEAADRMRESFDRLKGSVHTTADSYEVLERQVGEYEVLQRRVTTTTQTVVQAEAEQIDMLKHLGVQLEVTAAASAHVGHTLERNGSFGQGVMQASYAIQDFTSVMGTQGLGRALGAIQNNIPTLVSALGVGAGLTGVISVLSVGVGLLVDNWGKLTGHWKTEETEKEAKRMQSLAKATEDAAAAAERYARTHSRPQREEEGALKKAVEEFGGPAVVKELEEALKAHQGDFGPETNRKHAQTFFANLMQGNRKAWNMLQDLDLHGEVGAVLHGGPTPQERAQKAQRWRDTERRLVEDHQRKQKEEADHAAQQKQRQEEQARQDWERFQKPAKEAWEKGERRAVPKRVEQHTPSNETPKTSLLLFSREQIRDVQDTVFFNTGKRIDMATGARMLARQQDELNRAQREFGDAILTQMSGNDRQIAILRELTRRARISMDQGVMPSGLPR